MDSAPQANENPEETARWEELKQSDQVVGQAEDDPEVTNEWEDLKDESTEA